MAIFEADTLQRFIFEDRPIRGELVRLQGSFQAILARHDYPDLVQQWLGELLAAALLIGGIIKNESAIILQIQSAGPLRLLLAQASAGNQVRGLARWESEQAPTSFLEATEGGHLVMTAMSANPGKRYQGIIDLTQANLAACLQDYFTRSEQLPTFLALQADSHTAIGLLLQVLPQPEAETDLEMQWQWEHVWHLASTITAKELSQCSNVEILHRLFVEENIRIFDAEPVSFRCHCSRDRMEQAVLMLTAVEIDELLATHQKISVTCEFCNNHYDFDAIEVRLLQAGQTAYPDSSQQH